MNKKIKFEEYEYDRLLFLNEIIQGRNFDYIHDNKNFLRSLEDKYKDLDNDRNSKFADSYLYDNYFYKNKEFFIIFEQFFQKFKNLYGVFHQTEGGFNDNNKRKLVEDLYFIYMPLSRYFYKKTLKQTSPIICGIQAHQGCGKTTMTGILKFILEGVYDLNTEVLSIDDIYKTYEELSLLKKNDSRFKFRGPPGTHDIPLALSVLENVKNSESNYYLPRYNKSLHGGLGDRSEIGTLVTNPIDILLFEGWFLGSDPVDETELEMNQKDKVKLEFQKHINTLLLDYQPLWNYVDYWVVLKPEKFKYSRTWRAQAEKANKQGMNWKQIQDFLNYFWLTVPPHIYLAKIETKRNPVLTITLDKHRNFLL